MLRECRPLLQITPLRQGRRSALFSVKRAVLSQLWSVQSFAMTWRLAKSLIHLRKQIDEVHLIVACPRQVFTNSVNLRPRNTVSFCQDATQGANRQSCANLFDGLISQLSSAIALASRAIGSASGLAWPFIACRSLSGLAGSLSRRSARQADAISARIAFACKGVAVATMRFASIHARDGVPPQKIFLNGHCFQVARVDAQSIFAKVIDGKAGRNWAVGDFVRNAVRSLHSAVFASGSNTAVSVLLLNPKPLPTLIWRAFLNFGPEAFRDWLARKYARASIYFSQGMNLLQGLALIRPVRLYLQSFGPLCILAQKGSGSYVVAA